MKRKRFIHGEWVFTITGSTRTEPGAVRVQVENADGADRQFGRALALVIQAWWQARGGRS